MKKPVEFDPAKEKEYMEKLKESMTATKRHFLLLNIQDFYYKCRNLSDVYVDRCIHFCNEDIKLLPLLQEEFETEEKHNIDMMSAFSVLSDEEYNSKIDEIGVFLGRIQAFDKLIQIYKKRKELDKVDEINAFMEEYYNGKYVNTDRFKRSV
jgi:hypothetical protein